MVRSIQSKATTALATALLLSANIVTAQDGFGEIATDFGDSKPTGVVLPSICIGDFMVPKTMYTFEPAGVNETVSILTNPVDLVESGYDDATGLIFFKFNQNVSEVAEDAGMIIKFPPAQLESVNVCCRQTIQIKPGFTNFQSLAASTNAVANAEFAVEQEGNMIIYAQSKAEVNVKVAATAESKVGVAVEGAHVNIDGNITVINCIDESVCKVDGVISELSSSKADGSSTIKTQSCEGVEVKKDSTCETGDPKVTVVTSGDLVFSGLKEQCYGGDDLRGVNGPSPTYAPTVSPAPTISKVPTVAPTKKPTSPTRAPIAVPPTSAPTSGAFNAAKQGAFALSGAVLLLLLAQ